MVKAVGQSGGVNGVTGANSYTVKKGDTLWDIAQSRGISLQSLIKANPQIKNPDLIFPGQQINIPGGGKTSGSLGGMKVSPAKSPTERPSTRSSGAEPDEVDSLRRIEPPSGNTKGGVTISELRRIMPTLPANKAQQYLPYLNSAMNEAGINTTREKAAFLAQLAHESGELKYFEELASGAAYEGRRDLGNTQPGDGVRFKGRGPIQLTGRANYRAAGQALGINLERNPSRAADPDVAFRVAAWYWNSRNLNSYANAGNFDAITYRINGGYNGAADRNMYYRRALSALG